RLGQRRSLSTRVDRDRARGRCGRRRFGLDAGAAFRARDPAGCRGRGGPRGGDSVSLVRLPRIVEPLRHRDFRLLWTGQTLTLLGSFISNVAFPFQILLLGGGVGELAALVTVWSVASLTFLL